jgi:transcriptional regulator with XRE-family HTH domain
MKANLDTLRNSPVFAEEALVVDVQSLLETVMHEKGFTRSQLAAAMGVSRARISQLFSSDAKNFTVRLLARALHAMGERADVSCEGHRKERQRQRTVDMLKVGADFEPGWDLSWEPILAANDRDINVSVGMLDVNGVIALQSSSLGKVRIAA